MIAALVGTPTALGLLCLCLRRGHRALLILGALAHAALTVAAWVRRPAPLLRGWFALDPLGLVILSVTSALFLAAAVYAVGARRREVPPAGGSDRGLAGGLLLFLAAMTLVPVSRHFGILWVAIEATTLSSAPLILLHRHQRSIEAAWKYMLLCSVGIAVALLGTFLLAAGLPEGTPLLVESLLERAPEGPAVWLKAAFLCLLVGYGTKMGLAPLHSWLPDAHSEAPSAVSALLSGALLNCSFLGILRALQVCVAAGLGDFCRELLVGFGLLSMGFAAIFLLRQSDYKRMLAYSSVEHMGILALGVGLGGLGNFGALFHAVNHSLAKSMLFLVAGNFLAVYRTKSTAHVTGAFRAIPASGALWVAGFLAIVGTPPFGTFLSELTILRSALDQGRGVVAAAYLAFLALAFVGMSSAVLGMAQGRAPDGVGPVREGKLTVLPPIVLALAVLALGIYVPPPLANLLETAARSLEAAR